MHLFDHLSFKINLKHFENDIIAGSFFFSISYDIIQLLLERMILNLYHKFGKINNISFRSYFMPIKNIYHNEAFM